MQAITHDRYGSPDTLELRELAPPAIGDNEVLIRARAASLHPGDLFSVLGTPFPVRFMTGLRRPKYGVPGLDVAGTVEAVGSAVTHLRPGDEVFGCRVRHLRRARPRHGGLRGRQAGIHRLRGGGRHPDLGPGGTPRPARRRQGSSPASAC